MAKVMFFSLPFGLAKRKGSIRRMPFSTNEFNPENHYKINESEEEKMSKFEARRILDEINVAIANHKREWAGMLGTIWEKEDWAHKQEVRYQCLCVLCH